MKYNCMAWIAKLILQNPIFEYVAEKMPELDQKKYRKETVKEYRAIIERTESIGGSKNPFQMTMMFAAFAIAAYKSARPVITEELFEGMVDAVCYLSL